jgi:hypothetical protein
MQYQPLLRSTLCLLLIPALAGCSSLWPFGGKKKEETAPAPQSSSATGPSTTSKPAPQAPAIGNGSISAANLHGVWECSFQIKMGQDSAHFTYTDQFNPDGTLKAQAYLVYDMRSTQQQYSFVVQGEGSWRMEGNAITLIVPKVVKQDRSETKYPELVNDKDLVPEDLSDTWTVQAHQGKNMRVIVGSLADEMLCQKE